MKTDYVAAEIIDDSSDEEGDKTTTEKIPMEKIPTKKIPTEKIPTEKIPATKIPLKPYYASDANVFEIGVDEAGRGPLFGRVYTAAVILPKDNSFDFSKVKDSKKFHSKKKIEEAAEYVKKNALAWSVTYEDEQKIDEINILQATQSSMHKSIAEVKGKYDAIKKATNAYHLLIDGNYFNPFTTFNKNTNRIEVIPYVMIKGGDNEYASIAAASILAKVERDNYILALCEQNQELSANYGIDSNKGYGAKKHIDGIKQHGITIWHRRSFAPCKNYI